MKVFVGMSGGVDSAVAARLLLDEGHDVTAVTMTLGRAGDEAALEDARAAAGKAGIPFTAVDLSREWKENVLGYVKDSYLSGVTPNPCVRCNETVKFSLLPRIAFERGAERFATGHYARVAGGCLFRAVDHSKDQSYFLYRVEKNILERTLFPLGEMTKAEVRRHAASCGIESAEKGDSQDFCAGDVKRIVGESSRRGDIVTSDGKVLGTHEGFWRYTVGMRKGLGIGGGVPYYVIGLDAVENRVVVGLREECFRRSFVVGDLFPASFPVEGVFSVKVRSAGSPRGPVRVESLSSGKILVRCEEGISGVAPGQSAVFYDGDKVAFGGIISSENPCTCSSPALATRHAGSV